jgi:hypothetical protein
MPEQPAEAVKLRLINALRAMKYFMVEPREHGRRSTDHGAKDHGHGHGAVVWRRRWMLAAPQRVCSRCGRAKPLDAYTPIKGTPYYYRRCKPCRAEMAGAGEFVILALNRSSAEQLDESP